MKTLKGTVTISKVSGGSGDQWIEIRIEDDNSHITFVEAKLSLEEFGKAITGGAVRTEFEARGLKNVGLVRVTKELVFQLKGKSHNYKAEAESRCHDEVNGTGWIASGYYSSQNSIQHRDGKTYAHSSQYKFVKPDSEEGKAQLAEEAKWRIGM